jgi:hypothetical protein
MSTEHPAPSRQHEPWNKGRLVGQKRPLKPKDVWTIRLQLEGVLHDMRRRGLPDPLLVVSDGAPGMIRSIEECLPARQRCLTHKVRNLQKQGTVPEDLWPEFKACVVGCYQAPSPARQSRIPIRPVLVGYLRHRRSRGQH